MIFARILFPCAKLALVEEARGTLLAAACGLCQQSETFDEDDLYEARDGLNCRSVPPAHSIGSAGKVRRKPLLPWGSPFCLRFARSRLQSWKAFGMARKR